MIGVDFPFSTNLAAAGYEPLTGELYITFRNGSEYCYSGVPQEVFDGLVSAPSAGQFHAHFIKRSYPYRRVSR